MRDMLKRLERLESLSGGKDPIQLIIRFIVGKDRESVAARSMWVDGVHPSEAIERDPNETAEYFEERASNYFRRERNVPA